MRRIFTGAKGATPGEPGSSLPPHRPDSDFPVPRISQRSIEHIKQQVDLVELVAPYCQLKRSGRSWKGLSPFTQEKTPSFYVHPDQGFYKCFSTGEGGDCFSFVMRMENLDFAEAIEFIAKKFNITLEYEEGGPSREEISQRKQLFDLHEFAANWFHQAFMKSKEAADVRRYWQENRGFSLETAAEFKIGYAPADALALSRACEQKKIPPSVMQASGLFFSFDNNQDYGRFKSRFRGRLMIPIRDVQSRVVAFTARQLPQTPADDPAREAKYVNSPETPLFHKGRILFGLDHARTHLKENDTFLMVEGQLDAIRCWTVGLHTAVAPQGTAVTEDQLSLLRRYEPSAIECLLDGDNAGRKAALRILPLSFKAGLEFRFLMLPEKADPDDLLRQGGAAALNNLRLQAKSSIELCLAEYLPDDHPPSTHEKTSALRAVFELVNHLSSEVAQEDYIHQAARMLRVDAGAAMKDFQKNRRAPTRAQTSTDRDPGTIQDPLLTQAAWELLWLVLRHPETLIIVSQYIDYEWIKSGSAVDCLLRRILVEHQEGLLEETTQIEKLIDNVEERQLLADIHCRELDIEYPEKEVKVCLQRLYRKNLEIRLHELEQDILNADPDQQLSLMRERKKIVQALNQPLIPSS